MRPTILLALLGLQSLVAATPMQLPPSQFQSKHFKNNFVGSYGFLSPLEPKIDREESAVLAQVSEMFGESKFREAELLLLDFESKRKNPEDPELTPPKEISAALVFVMGNLYYQSGRTEMAEKSFKKALEMHNNFRRAHKNLALMYASPPISDIDRALPHLKKAIQLGDADHQSYGLLGYAYLSKEKPLAAEGAYRQAYLLEPDEKDWQLGLAQSLLLQEQWPESAAMLGELLDKDPNNAQLWKQQANCYLGMEDRLKAATVFEVMRYRGIADAETLNLLGDIYVDQEKPLLALGSYLAATEKAPTLDADRAVKKAEILANFGAPKEAAKLIEAVRKKGGDNLERPTQVRMKLVEANVAKELGNSEWEDALLANVLELDANNGEALVMHGQFFERLAGETENDEKAVEYRAQARSKFKLALNQEDPKVLYTANLRFGQMLIRQKDYTRGLPYLKAAIDLKPSDGLKQYIRQVDRAATKQREREEREAAEQDAIKKALERAKAHDAAKEISEG